MFISRIKSHGTANMRPLSRADDLNNPSMPRRSKLRATEQMDYGRYQACAAVPLQSLIWICVRRSCSASVLPSAYCELKLLSVIRALDRMFCASRDWSFIHAYQPGDKDREV